MPSYRTRQRPAGPSGPTRAVDPPPGAVYHAAPFDLPVTALKTLMIPRPTLSLATVALLGLLGAALVTTACGGKSGGAGAVDYSVSAQRNYEKGVKELEDKDWLAASKYFQFIKSRFPYSKYAVLAELRLADAQFGAEQYIEAIDSYRLFIKFHPTHDMVANGYASFRIGEGYYRQLSGDFWMFPPSSEKDQSSTEDAANELKTFLDKYPDSPYREKSSTSIGANEILK